MELVATLYDVGPDGTAKEITFGALLGSMRDLDTTKSWTDSAGRLIKPVHPFTHDVPLEPGRAQRFDIAIIPAVYAIPAGHSLRLTISTQAPATECGILAAFGRARPCVLTKAQQASLTGGTYQVLSGGTRASSMNVPLVRTDSLHNALSCVLPTSTGQPEPVGWDGGPTTPRSGFADWLTCLGAWFG